MQYQTNQGYQQNMSDYSQNRNYKSNSSSRNSQIPLFGVCRNTCRTNGKCSCR